MADDRPLKDSNPNQRPLSYAREINPEGGIKAKPLTPVFDRAADPPPPNRSREQPSPIHSRQVANSSLKPREPAPPAAYDRAKAAQHVDGMRADDRAVKDAALKAKAELFARQDAARKASRSPSLGPTLGKSRDRERGD